MAHWLVVQTNHGRAVDGTQVLSDRSLTEQHTAGRPPTATPSAGTPTDPLAPDPARAHGNLLTYSAYMEVLPESGYGVVVLLNAGSGLMLDQIGIFYGVAASSKEPTSRPAGPAGTTFNVTTIDRALGLLTLLVALLGARGILRAGRWARDGRQQPWTYTAARMAPYLAVLGAALVYPQLAERLTGGREVTWEEAAYGWPALTVLVWTLLVAVLANVGARAWHLARRTTSRALSENHVVTSTQLQGARS